MKLLTSKTNTNNFNYLKMKINIYNLLIIIQILFISSIEAVPWNIVSPGHVGIYYFMGTLQNYTASPGYYFKYPWPITIASESEVRPQTDYLTNVKCGAGDGTQLIFDQVQVGNQLNKDYVISTIRRYGEDYDNYLIKDKVRAQINVICSKLNSHEIYIDQFDTLDDRLVEFLQEENNKLDTGITINFVRFDKPNLPHELQLNYNKIAEHKTGLKVAQEETLKIEQEHKNKILKAEKEAEAVRVKTEKESQMMLEKAQKEEEVSIIQNRIHIESERAKADAIKYSKQSEAEGNDKLLTSNYVELEKARAISSNSKHYFGDVPNALFLNDDFKKEQIPLMAEKQ